MCLQLDDETLLGFSPDLSREEKVKFVGRLKHPLIFRDTMLMLREIVISDLSQKKKERLEFFEWLNQEVERRTLDHENYLKGVREEIQDEMIKLNSDLDEVKVNLDKLLRKKRYLQNEIDKLDVWREYYKLERDFWAFIRNRDEALWYVLDPVITVHPDQVSFEAFSKDESTYGCISVDMDEFNLKGMPEPQLGTTNIDFSIKLAREMERFRTYNDIKLSINPEGFTVDTGVTPEHVEKKIDLPESWIKGFNQVSAAASLGGYDIDLKPVDMYDICSFLRRHKAHESPRHMQWTLEPDKYIKVLFKPWDKELELSSIYTGAERIEKIWGRRRWLTLEKLIPIAKSFKLRMLGFGLPQFIIADLGTIKMTTGFTSWTSNDWVSGTAFNIMAGFIGKANSDVHALLQENRYMSIEEISKKMKKASISKIKSGLGNLLRCGEAYFDLINNKYRFRKLCNIPLPSHLYEETDFERQVTSLLHEIKNKTQITKNKELEIIADYSYSEEQRYKDFETTTYMRYGRERTRRESIWKRRELIKTTQIKFDQDNRISKVKCDCKEYKKGPRNISNPCPHLLALLITIADHIKKPFEVGTHTIKELEDFK